MSLFAASLNSGSNGNCYYIGTQREGILIDCGISHREVKRRLQRLMIPIETIKAIFITHEHNDHVVGVAKVSRKHRIPVYVSAKTNDHFNFGIEDSLLCIFHTHDQIKIGQLRVMFAPRLHDAVDAHSVLVENGTTKVGVFTDLGKACDDTIQNFKQCHAAFLESNYDEAMLETGRYSFTLKNRVRGDYGHLSNKQALQLFLDHRSPSMSHLFLSHLSQNNNREQIVKSLFEPWNKETKIIIASRKKETALFKIGTDETVQLKLFA